jgi:hypothetical protein
MFCSYPSRNQQTVLREEDLGDLGTEIEALNGRAFGLWYLSRTVVWQLGTAKQQCRSHLGQVYAIGLATSAALRI